jgi:hypothetical protein
MKILNKAVSEEDARRNKEYNEFKKLADATSKAINEAGINKDSILKTLAEDISISKTINESFKPGIDPPPLVYNKLLFLLEGAKIVTERHFDQIVSGDLSFIPMPEGKYEPDLKSQYITSLPNYTQTAMLGILSIIRKVPVYKIPELEQEKIYNINLSPNIQGIKAANSCTLDPVKDWKWCLDGSAPESKGYSELIVPGLGYYFGGSRYDKAYEKKYFQEKDCSSAIAQWAGSSVEFSTADILNHTPDVLKVLEPLKEDREPIKGDVFCFKGHTGVVTGYSDEEAPLYSLSYARTMPFFEGLIYQEYPQINGGKNVITADWKALSQLEIVEPYYGLDNPLGNPDNPSVSGEIFYFEGKEGV